MRINKQSRYFNLIVIFKCKFYNNTFFSASNHSIALSCTFNFDHFVFLNSKSELASTFDSLELIDPYKAANKECD